MNQGGDAGELHVRKVLVAKETGRTQIHLLIKTSRAYRRRASGDHTRFWFENECSYEGRAIGRDRWKRYRPLEARYSANLREGGSSVFRTDIQKSAKV